MQFGFSICYLHPNHSFIILLIALLLKVTDTADSIVWCEFMWDQGDIAIHVLHKEDTKLDQGELETTGVKARKKGARSEGQLLLKWKNTMIAQKSNTRSATRLSKGRVTI